MVNIHSEKEIQQKYVEMQMLEQQIKQVQKQLQLLENQMIELQVAKQNLDELRDSKIGSKILAQVTPGVYVKAKLEHNDNLIVNVGAGVSVSKNVDSAKSMLDEQINQIVRTDAELLKGLQKLDTQFVKIEKELNAMLPKK